MNRRRFVVTAASAGAVATAVAAGCSAGRFGPNVGSGVESLVRGATGAASYTLRVQYATNSIAGYRLRTRTYDGKTVGPVLHVNPGEMLDVEIDNQLPPNPPAPIPQGKPMLVPDIHDEMDTMKPRPTRLRPRRASVTIDPMNNPHDFNTTNLHVHGIQTIPHIFFPIGTSDPKAMQLAVEPGKRFRYNLPVPANHPCGLHWFHPHHHGATDVQVSGGMAGLIVVHGPVDQVPEIAAARDILVVLQTLQVNPSKSDPHLYDLEYKAYAAPDKGGYNLDTEFTMFTVNGTGVLWADNLNKQYTPLTPPTISMKQGEVIRLRLLNGTNQMSMGLACPGLEMWQIGFDGVNLLKPSLINMSADNVPGGALTATNFIDAHVRMTMPGNRIEFLIKAPDKPGKYVLTALRADDIHGPPTPVDLIVFEVTKGNQPMDIPRKLPVPAREYPLIPEGKPKRKFLFKFESTDQVLTSAGFFLDNLEPAPYHHLYEEMVSPTNVQLNAEEEWTIENASGVPHPFHIHVNSFQLTAINDVPNNPAEIWDTFYVPPKRSRTDNKNGSITFRIRFLDFKGKSLMHCHFLSHEDTGMMQNFTIL